MSSRNYQISKDTLNKEYNGNVKKILKFYKRT